MLHHRSEKPENGFLEHGLGESPPLEHDLVFASLFSIINAVEGICQDVHVSFMDSPITVTQEDGRKNPLDLTLAFEVEG